MMYKYILTFTILVGGAEIKREVVKYDRKTAIEMHDRYNFKYPNQCKIDSVKLKTKKDGNILR